MKICYVIKTKLRRHKNFFVLTIILVVIHDLGDKIILFFNNILAWTETFYTVYSKLL